MTTDLDRTVTAARGTTLRCRNWRAEALLRMLENVLEVGERPRDLVVYAALGKAARDWPSYHAIVEALTELGDDQTLVMQSGRPVGVMRTHASAPMVVSAVNNTVGNWATEETFYRRMSEGSTIWGGLTAAAWQYIGRQECSRALTNCCAPYSFGTSPTAGRAGCSLRAWAAWDRRSRSARGCWA